MELKNFFITQQDGMKALATTGVMGLHMVSGPAVGFGIGYGIDAFAGTTPWGGLIMLLLGFGAGFLNVWRDARELVSRLDKKPETTRKDASA